ncbi:hypothetical protein [Paremcibacter congregatus]|uniref:hypothetical protein n=1 Tax=Paremcibacter congregatus TaxID=2043170 RepID=UPI003A93F179
MRKKAADKPAKTLRQRVADRKAGVQPEQDPRREKILGRVRLAATLSQGVGLVMLLVVLAQYISSGYAVMNWIEVMVYSGLFLAGRAVTSFLNLSNITR